MKDRMKYKSEKYLADFLRIAPLSHALWRTTEALVFDQYKFKKPVLDLGCGFGEFAGIVFNQVEMGIDINDKELSQAIKSKKYKKVQWADARKLPFPNNSFATVISVSVLEHIPHVEKALLEINRVLREQGLLIFAVPTVEIKNNLLLTQVFRKLGLVGLADQYFDLHSKVFKHHSLKKSDWWVQVLEKQGFEVINLQGTISSKLLKLHEFFLLSALPSQFWKWIFGKRLLMTTGLRAKILPMLFSQYTYPDKNCFINIFVVARKR